MIRRLLLLLVTMLPALAARAADVPAGPGASDVLRVLLALGLVIAVIVAVATLARGSGRLPGASARTLRVVDSLSLGGKEKLVVVDAGATRLVLGIAPGRVAALHVIEDGADAPAPAGSAATGASGFAADLRRAVADRFRSPEAV